MNIENKLVLKKAYTIYFIILFIAFINFLSIILAPLMINSGGFLSVIAGFIYTLFSKSCHQIKDRSFFLFGNQLPVCIRCFSIYSGFLLGSIILPFLRSGVLFSFPKVWVFISAVCFLIIDVILHLLGFLENSILTRLITGGFLGFISAFFIIPAFTNAYFEIIMFYNQKKLKTNDNST